MRSGILGGTFDPPHRAHLLMAAEAADRLPLDRVLFMPAPAPPHKSTGDLSPFDVRARMVELAIQDDERFELSFLEQFREGFSYTHELLEHFTKNVGDEVYFIVGADSVNDFPTWKKPEKILQLATLVVFPRTGYSSRVPIAGEASVVLFEEPLIDLSSSDLRERIRNGEPVEGDVPDAVLRFILDNSLYS